MWASGTHDEKNNFKWFWGLFIIFGPCKIMRKHTFAALNTQHILSLYLKECNKIATDFKTTMNHRRLFSLWRFLLTISLITVFNVSFYNLQCVFLFRMCCYCLQMSLALLINKQVIQCCYIGGSRQVLLDKPLQTQKVDCLNLCQKQTQKDHFFLWQTWH